MKILILTDKLEIGGAETHIAQLATELTKSGHEVLVASRGGKTADWLEACKIPQINLPLDTHSPIRWLILRHKIRKLIRSESIDVAHAHARIPALLIHGVRRMGCAEIVAVHAKFRSGFLRRLLSCWGENSIAVSEDLRAYLHSVYQIPMQRIEVIPNGIDLMRFSPREKIVASDTVLRILFASRLDADCSRGAELLCEIAPTLAERLGKITVTVVGGGKKMPEIAERAKKINRLLGFDCISVIGTVQDMGEVLSEQDIFVGVSRAALEAAAAGCAVILCGNEGYAGILKKENFLDASLANFCARGQKQPTAQELLRDVLELASSPALRQSCADECHALVEQWHDAASACQKTVGVYQKSLHRYPLATVVIGGYFGCGNLGDDAILQSFVEYTRTNYPNMRIYALTKKPRQNTRRFGVCCRNRKNPLALISLFLCADAFLCGGGSLLQNVTGKLSLYYYLCMLRLAKLCGAMPLLYAAGIGPLTGECAIRATRKVLSLSPYISLRDKESLRFLRGQRLDSAQLHLGADAALLLQNPPVFRTYALLKRMDVAQNQPYICICLKSGKDAENARQILTTSIKILCLENRLLPIFIPLDKGDFTVNAEAARKLGGKLFVADEASDVTALLRNAELLVSMRLHGLILATNVFLPSIGIPFGIDPKIPSFCRIAAQEFLGPKALSVAALADLCQKTLARKNTLRPIIADACRDLQKNAQKDLANICAMVYNKGRYTKKSEDTL